MAVMVMAGDRFVVAVVVVVVVVVVVACFLSFPFFLSVFPSPA